jgi:hypothetical protein
VQRCRKADVSEKHFCPPIEAGIFLGRSYPCARQPDLDDAARKIRSSIEKCRPAFGRTAFPWYRFDTTAVLKSA